MAKANDTETTLPSTVKKINALRDRVYKLQAVVGVCAMACHPDDDITLRTVLQDAEEGLAALAYDLDGLTQEVQA